MKHSRGRHPTHIRRPSSHERQQGIALVVVILCAMVLIVALLAVTSTLALSSRRTTTDQRVTLQAQYAAESGLSRARSELVQLQNVLSNVTIPANTNARDIDAHARSFCNQSALEDAAAGANWSPEERRWGVQICEATPVTPDDDGRFSLFTSFIPNSALPDGADPDEYWLGVFGGSTEPAETLVAKDPETGAETWYSTSFSLMPRAVRLMGADNYRFEFAVSPVESVGEVRVNGKVVATRTVQLDTPGTFDMSIEKPPFPRFVQFRNNTKSTRGRKGQLYFGSDERFDGYVHTNGRPGLARWNRNDEPPQFFSRFTTASRNAKHYNVSKEDYPNIFRDNRYKFGVDNIPLPTNNNSQLRASFGGDARNSSNVSDRDLREAWGVSRLESGVYYSEGNGSQANQSNSLQGGIYVKGNVSDLIFSTRGNKQIIKITREEVLGTRIEQQQQCFRIGGQRFCFDQNVEVPVVETKTTTFEQTGDDTWLVEDEEGQSRTLLGNFNGMIYVDGNIESLGGDGTNKADIAEKSQITLATTGDVVVKQSLTYTDHPREDEDALNVLGIFSDGGSVLLDGPKDQDLNVHASVMASARGKGFGTVDPGGDLPNGGRGTVRDEETGRERQARINLIGGVIEDQSQTVSIGDGGYERNYAHDPRFADGFSPPFFPTQTNWEGEAQTFSRERGLWEVKAR